MKSKEWLAFIGLSLAWGSSFLWIKIAVDEVGPFTLVALRLLFGLLGLAVVVLLRRPKWPVKRSQWLALCVLGLSNVAVPFVLISWGEQFIDSAVASILNSTVPLFTTLIAHFFLEDDRLTWRRVTGLLVGFLGVVIVVWRDLNGSAQANLLGQGAVLIAALMYAFSAVFTRYYTKGVSSIIQSFFPLIIADSLMWITTPIVEAPFTLPKLPITWVAIVWLGLIGSCVAYLLYYYLLNELGPTRATLVTYTFPVVGVVLGYIFLNEHMDLNLVAGTVLVLGSIAIVNSKSRK